MSLLLYLRLAYFSKSKAERGLFRAIRRKKVASIVEVGIGKAERTCRMLRLARQVSPHKVRYTGIDLFEARQAPGSGISFKQAHKRLAGLSVKVRLVPGDPFQALTRRANELVNTELVVISADLPADSMRQAWFYLPRILSESAVVFLEHDSNDPHKHGYRLVGRDEIDHLARAANGCSRAAAA